MSDNSIPQQNQQIITPQAQKFKRGLQGAVCLEKISTFTFQEKVPEIQIQPQEELKSEHSSDEESLSDGDIELIEGDDFEYQEQDEQQQQQNQQPQSQTLADFVKVFNYTNNQNQIQFKSVMATKTITQSSMAKDQLNQDNLTVQTKKYLHKIDLFQNRFQQFQDSHKKQPLKEEKFENLYSNMEKQAINLIENLRIFKNGFMVKKKLLDQNTLKFDKEDICVLDDFMYVRQNHYVLRVGIEHGYIRKKEILKNEDYTYKAIAPMPEQKQLLVVTENNTMFIIKNVQSYHTSVKLDNCLEFSDHIVQVKTLQGPKYSKWVILLTKNQVILMDSRQWTVSRRIMKTDENNQITKQSPVDISEDQQRMLIGVGKNIYHINILDQTEKIKVIEVDIGVPKFLKWSIPKKKNNTHRFFAFYQGQTQKEGEQSQQTFYIQKYILKKQESTITPLLKNTELYLGQIENVLVNRKTNEISILKLMNNYNKDRTNDLQINEIDVYGNKNSKLRLKDSLQYTVQNPVQGLIFDGNNENLFCITGNEVSLWKYYCKMEDEEMKKDLFEVILESNK